MDKVIPALLTVSLILVLFCATVGISTSSINDLQASVDSLRLKVEKLNAYVELEKEANNALQDTLVVDVRVNPQTIKIYNRCTN